jgi:hypothetical protein
VERLQVLVALKRRNRFLNLSVPAYAIYLGIAGVVAILVLGSLVGSSAVSRLTDYGRLGRLARENTTLKAQVASYAAAMDTFRQFLVKAEQMDNKLRASINMPLIPGDIRLMGIGGSQPPSPEPGVDAMLRRLRFEQQSMAEIEGAVKDQQARLANMPSIWPVRISARPVHRFELEPSRSRYRCAGRYAGRGDRGWTRHIRRLEERLGPVC